MNKFRRDITFKYEDTMNAQESGTLTENIDINLDQIFADSHFQTNIDDQNHVEENELLTFGITLKNIKRLNLPTKQLNKDEHLLVKFTERLFNSNTNEFLKSACESEWIKVDPSFLKTSGNTVSLELNDINYSTYVTVYKNEIIYLINEIEIAKAKGNHIIKSELYGFQCFKLQARVHKDENMLNYSSALLPMLKVDGYTAALNKAKSSNFECRLTTEVKELKEKNEFHKVMGLFTLWEATDEQKQGALIKKDKIFIKEVKISLPRNFETSFLKKQTDYTQQFKPTIVSRDLKLQKMNNYNLQSQDARSVTLNYKNSTQFTDIVVIDPMCATDMLQVELSISLKFKEKETSRTYEFMNLVILNGVINLEFDSQGSINPRKYMTTMYNDLECSALSNNISKVQSGFDTKIQISFDASAQITTNRRPSSEVQNKLMSTQEILDRSNQRKREQEEAERKRRQEQEKKRQEEELKNMTMKSDSLAPSLMNTAKQEDLQKMQQMQNMQNMPFVNTAKTEYNDQRLIDMQREVDALKDHNQTLVASMAEKDSMVKSYLVKLETLTEQLTRLEGKMHSNTVMSQQNLMPYQDKSAMLHPSNKDDEIDSSNVQQARTNIAVKDSMHEQQMDKQHILKLSSLGIHVTQGSAAQGALTHDKPVAFDITLQLLSLLNQDDNLGTKFQFHIMVQDHSIRSPVLTAVKKKMDETEYRSILLLNASYKLGDDNIFTSKFRLDSTSILKQLEQSNVRVCDSSKTLHKDLAAQMTEKQALVQIQSSDLEMQIGQTNVKLAEILEGQFVMTKECSWWSQLTNNIGGLLSINFQVDMVEPAIESAMLDKTQSLISYSHDLNNLSCTYSNSNQIEQLDEANNIDPIFTKIKRMSDRLNPTPIKDSAITLEAKHKMNNDIKQFKDKIKEVKLKNLVRQGNNASVSVNVRHGGTTCFTLPISNDSEQPLTQSIKVDDEQTGDVIDNHFNCITYVSNSTEQRTIKDQFNLKHVDVNKVSMDKYAKITVEAHSTGFLILKQVCLQLCQDVAARDVKICLLKDAVVAQTFSVNIHPLPDIHVNKVYRFNEPEQRHVKLQITDFVNYESVKNLYFLSDNNKVSMGLNKEGNLSVSMLTKKAPNVERFTIYIYQDKYQLSLVSMIQVQVTSQRCMDLTLTMGQSSAQTLYLPPMNAELCKFKYISSSRVDLNFAAPQNQAFNPSKTNLTAVEYTVACQEVCNSIRVMVHLVGEESKALKWSQMMVVSLSMPDISKQQRIPTSEDNKNIKFAYENQKGLSQTQIFESSNPKLLKVKDEKLMFNTNEKKAVNLEIVQKISSGNTEEVMIYVKDNKGALEDCILFKLIGDGE